MIHKEFRFTLIKVFPLVHALFLAFCVFLLNYQVAGPMIQGDEGGYLANAAAIAGFHNDLASSYHAGYSFLIAPAFYIFDTPQSIWLTVKVINSALYLLLVVALWWIVKRLFISISFQKQFSAVTLVSLYPMWVIMAGYSFPQIAFATFFLLTFIVFVKAFSMKNISWFFVGLIAGFLYWIHPIGIVPIIAGSIAVSYLGFIHRRYSLPLFFMVSALGILILYRYGINPWLTERMTISGLKADLHYQNALRQFRFFYDYEGLISLLGHIGGHVFYITTGTLGLVWLGLLSLLQQSLNVSRNPTGLEVHEWRAISLFLGLSFLGIEAISILMFSGPLTGQRLDHWMYGRYVEGVLAPILLIGILGSRLKNLIWIIPIMVAAATLLAFTLKSYTHTAPFNISAFFQYFFLENLGVWAWLAAGCVVIVVAAFLKAPFGWAFIIVIFWLSIFFQQKYHISSSYAVERSRWVIGQFIRQNFPRGTCVGFDYISADNYNRKVYWHDLGFLLFDYKLKRLTYEQWLKSCEGPFFTFDREIGSRAAGKIYPISRNPIEGILWIRYSDFKDVSGFIDLAGDPTCFVNGCFEMSYIELASFSKVGRVTDNGLKSTGASGYLFFGPYRRVEAGDYYVEIKLEVSAAGKANFDVVSERGGKKHIDVQISDYFQAGQNVIRVPFSLDKQVTDIEVRLYISKDSALTIYSYALKINDGGVNAPGLSKSPID